MKDLNFGQAIEALKQGKKVARIGWNGKGMFVVLSKIHTHTPLEQGGVNAVFEPFFSIKTVNNVFNTWVASVSDTLAEDWQIVE
jgi:hypothetical protein